MKDNKIEKINTVLFETLKEISNLKIHYISPDKDTPFPYIAFRYEKGEDFSYILTLDTWTKNEDIEILEEILETLIDNLDKKILFKTGMSFRFYYANKGEIEVIDGSDIIGREINFEMRIC